ncbi:MAG: SCO family protein [Porticoccaceae bacterium]|jgi:protein SCO1/2
MEQKNRIRMTIVALIAFILLVVYGFTWRISQPVIMSKEELQINGAIVLEKPRIFSDFELVDHRGDLFNIERMQGIWSIVFFGFTHCPDICPTTLAMLNDTYSKLKDSEKERLQIVMISLDSERDTVEKLAEYVPYFNQEFIGVTGNKHLIRRLTAELNVAYNQVPLSGDDYTVDHSTQLILINPMGHYHGFFKAPHTEITMRSTWRSIDGSSKF